MACPQCPQKTRQILSPSIFPSTSLPSTNKAHVMPVHSKFSSPRYTDDDYPSGSPDMLSPSPASKNRSAPASRHPDLSCSHFYKSTPVNPSRCPSSGVLFRRSGSNVDAYQRPRHPLALESCRSHSYISVSSDNPDATTIELVELHKENIQLKVNCGRLKGQITILK